jgi:hypothetical protein
MLDRALGLVWTTCALPMGSIRPGMNQTGHKATRNTSDGTTPCFKNAGALGIGGFMCCCDGRALR